MKLPPRKRCWMTKKNSTCLVIIGALLLLWFGLLGHRDLIDPDEGRYAEIPREMLASGDWVTPRLNDLKYFEKPPLQYWSTAVAYKVLGVSNFTSRLWIALFGFIGAVWAAYISKSLYGREAGWYTFLISCSSFLYFGLSHYLTLDLTLSVCLMFGMGSLILAQQERHSPERAAFVRNWMLVAWLALAAAVLTKGLVGLVLPAGSVLIYSLWQRDWQLWRHLHLFKGLMILLLVSAPWFVMVSLRNPEFFSFFFIHEHFDRYTTNVNHHEAPFYYFALIFFAGALPWSYTIFQSLLRPLFDFRKRDTHFNAERFLWVFIVFTVVFFSLSSSKLPGYILPAFPAAAILAANRLLRSSSLGGEVIFCGFFGAVLLLAVLALPRFATASIPYELLSNYRPWISIAAASLLVGAAGAWYWRSQLSVAVPILALSACISFQCLLSGFQSVAPARSSSIIANRILALPLKPNTVIYMVDEYLPSLPFYLQRPVIMAVARSELALGVTAEPQKWIETPEQFVQRWQQDISAVAVIANEDFETYRQLNMSMDIVYEGARDKIVVKNVR